MSTDLVKHTAPPWEISPSRTVDGTWMVVAGQGHDFGLVADVTTEADAHLVAAAPKLLDALKALTCGLPELLESIGYADEEGLIPIALDAIAMAEGRPAAAQSTAQLHCVNHLDRVSRTNLDGDELCQECADAWVHAEGQWAAGEDDAAEGRS